MISDKEADCESILVYSEYVKLQKNDTITFFWQNKENDQIQENQLIGYLQKNLYEEKTDIISPYKGVLLQLPEKNQYTLEKISQSPKLVMRIRVCPATYKSEQSLSHKSPDKLPINLELLYYFSTTPQNNRHKSENIIEKTLRITKIKSIVNKICKKGDEILIIECLNEIYRIKAPVSGYLTWTQDLNMIFSINDPIFSINPCKHPELFQENICTNCSEIIESASNINEIKDHCHLLIKTVTIRDETEKKRYALHEKQAFLDKKQLILILDLDNTLIHAVKVQKNFNNKAFEGEKDIYEWLVNTNEKFLIKLRPYLSEFFEKIKNKYTCFLYTSGTRSYADFNRCIINSLKGAELESQKMIALEDNFLDLEKKIKRMLPYTNDIVLILDDNANVWPDDKRNLIFTKKFLFFPEEKMLESLEKDFQTKPFDNFLYFSGLTLHKIYKTFFSLQDLGKKPDVRQIYRYFQKNLFKGIKISFTRLVNKAIPFMENMYVKICHEYGATVIEDFDLESLEKPHILLGKDYSKTHKINLAKNLNIPVVHFNWVDYCIMYCNLLVWKTFQLNEENQKILSNQDIEKKLFLENKQFIEENEEKIIQEAVENLKKSKDFSN